MSNTNFAHGVSSYGVPVFGTAGQDVIAGKIFWVGSVAGGSWIAGVDDPSYGVKDKPFATIDYAIGKCTASNGDTIYVLPGHTEDIVGASSFTLDVAGVRIIGLGSGSLKPTLTFKTAAGATLNITAANCWIENLRLYANYTNGVTTGLTVGADADGLVLKNIEMEESANTTEFLIGITVAAGCNRMIIDGLDFYGVAGGTDSQCILFSGASSHTIIRNCRFYGDWSASVVDALTAASINMLFENNFCYQLDASAGLAFGVKSDTTGVYRFNHSYGATDGAGLFVGNAMAHFENYHTNALTASGFIHPAIDS